MESPINVKKKTAYWCGCSFFLYLCWLCVLWFCWLMNAEVELCKEEVIYANIILHLYTSFSSVKFWFLKLEALLWRPFFTHSKSIYLLDDLALFPLRNVWLYPWQCSLLWSLFCLIFSSVQSLSHVRLFATPWSSPPCPSTPGVHSNSCSLSQWCHPTISSSVIPFSSCLQCFPSSGSFKMWEISIISDMQMTPPLWQKVKRN